MDKKITERLRSLRLENGYTQREIADYLYLSTKAYSDYELGKNNITVDDLVRLASLYKVGMDYICGVSDTP